MKKNELIQVRIDGKEKEAFEKKAGKKNASYVLRKLIKGYNNGTVKLD